MLQRAAESAGARDADRAAPERRAPSDGASGTRRARPGSGVSWAMVTPSGRRLSPGQRPAEGKTGCQPPSFATLQN